MNTFLCIWNPDNYAWKTIDDEIRQISANGKYSRRWSCGNTKSIKPGDRIFLFKLGTHPKGLIGEGYATTEPYPDKHWSGNEKTALYIDIDFNIILNPDTEPILSIDVLKIGILSQQTWTPQTSGISIRPEIINELDLVWSDFLRSRKNQANHFTSEYVSTSFYEEGTPYEVTLTMHERNQQARKTCLEHHGYYCIACKFNFEDTYGPIGKDFIHVHHLTKISDIGESYKIDAIKDLCPVCPNCHSMIHKHKEPLEIDELKRLLQKQKK
jgi:5-methylcytosine-specific restriction protein A